MYVFITCVVYYLQFFLQILCKYTTLRYSFCVEKSIYLRSIQRQCSNSMYLFHYIYSQNNLGHSLSYYHQTTLVKPQVGTGVIEIYERNVNFRHITRNTSRIRRRVSYKNVLMGIGCRNTRFPGSLLCTRDSLKKYTHLG